MKTSLMYVLCTALILSACGAEKSADGVRIVTDTVNVTEQAYTLTLRVPQIKGLNDSATQTDVNDRLKKIVDDAKTGFLNEIKDIVIEPGDDTKSGLTVDYKAGTFSQDILSIVLEASPYMAGAAHPNHVSVSFVYDVATKKEIAFTDLFNTNAKYLERLSTLTIEQLIAESKKKGTFYAQKEQTIRQGAGPKAENFRTFSIENGSIVLTFDPYQVGPYAEGTQTVTLSRAQITDVLSNYGRKLLSETEKKS
ncbi:DUF3298 and DUF4163 domain-containing protein [Candidatus Peribacteria bacterium]|nr:MAG: DUF3298 and DUF4163 domain-containing protein [Candidatus Peribacteria bacterium]